MRVVPIFSSNFGKKVKKLFFYKMLDFVKFLLMYHAEKNYFLKRGLLKQRFFLSGETETTHYPNISEDSSNT